MWDRRAFAVVALALGGAAWWFFGRSMRNVYAFRELVGALESNGDYQVIAGGDRFEDFSEHPFVLEPGRRRPLNTTASGKYQMVRKTWGFARDALGLPDFSPSSQDQAAEWLMQFKVPGQDVIAPGGTGNLEIVRQGRFEEAIAAYRLEWEALDKILRGRYSWSLDQARELYVSAGGTFGQGGLA